MFSMTYLNLLPFKSFISCLQAFLTSYPDASPSGCDVHFKRALRRNLQSRGLISFVNSCSEFQTFIRYLWGLSLVPPEHITTVWEGFINDQYAKLEQSEIMSEELEEEVSGFLDYFEKTYIGHLNQRTYIRKKPLFSSGLWNKHQWILTDGDLTNNSAEGFNSALGLSLQKNNTIWFLISQLRQEEAFIRLKLRDESLGAHDAQRNSSRALKVVERRRNLKSLVTNYPNLSIKEFMESVSSFYNDNL